MQVSVCGVGGPGVRTQGSCSAQAASGGADLQQGGLALHGRHLRTDGPGGSAAAHCQ